MKYIKLEFYIIKDYHILVKKFRIMNDKLTTIIEQLKSLTLLEAAELVKEIEYCITVVLR